MTTEEEVFVAAMAMVDEALDLAPPAREALFARAALDPEVVAEARRLLEADASGDELLLPRPAATSALAALIDARRRRPNREAAGALVGPFRLVALLGKGGMGEVWEAARVGADFEQRVALKLLPATEEATGVLRFLRERQILARLSHPRIARLLDGGVTSEGRPWLAMELVPGKSLTEHVATHALDVDARLRLFVDACAGVQFAHNHLVVHRDLKPGNILVTPDGDLKLLDFGIAKRLEQDDAPLTRTHERPMTLDYAAPEQILGDAITTATDVWALGVILYELLTGTRPYRATARSRVELEGAILRADPARPSSSLGQELVGRPPGSARALRRTLRGDLDAIVLKAMRRDPGDRYASAEALGADVRRYLERAPVAARGEATGYLVRAMVRRHKLAFAVSAVALFSLVAGLVGTLWQARRAREAARKAEVSEGFLVSMLKAFDPLEAGGRAVTQREILERGEARLADLEAEPEVQARLLQAFAETWYGLEDYDHARATAERALAIETRVLGPKSVEGATTLGVLGNVAFVRGDYAQSARVFERAAAIAREVEGPSGLTLAGALNDLAGAERRLAALPAAERLRHESLAIYTKRLGEDDPTTLRVGNDLAVLLGDEGRYDESAALLRRVCARLAATLGPDHATTLTCKTNLARPLIEQGHAAEAEVLLRDLAAREVRALGDDRADIANIEQWRGYALDELGRTHEAMLLFDDALDRKARTDGADHPDYARILGRKATAARHAGRLAEAEELSRRALAICVARLGERHPCAARARLVLGATLADEGRASEAEGELARALEIFDELLGPVHVDTASARDALARARALAASGPK